MAWREARPTKESGIMAHILILSGISKGLKYQIPTSGTILGRQSTNDIPLPDDQVSRQHCRIFWEQNGCYLEDLGSRNGTLVNGDKVSGRCLLASQDEIAVGDTKLRFCAEEELPLSSPPLREIALPQPAAPVPQPSPKRVTRQMQRPPRAAAAITVSSPAASAPSLPIPAKPITSNALASGNRPLTRNLPKRPWPAWLAIDFSEYPLVYQLAIGLGLVVLVLLGIWMSRWITLYLLE